MILCPEFRPFKSSIDVLIGGHPTFVFDPNIGPSPFRFSFTLQDWRDSPVMGQTAFEMLGSLRKLSSFKENLLDASAGFDLEAMRAI